MTTSESSYPTASRVARANEPAFPIHVPDRRVERGGLTALRMEITHPGLTVREAFAKDAMQGLLAATATVKAESRLIEHVPEDIEEIAVMCADLLLAQLAKQPAPPPLSETTVHAEEDSGAEDFRP